MGPESSRGRRFAPLTLADRERRQALGRDGHAASAERQACYLQDTTGDEGRRRAA